jgi:hypothetical protein
VISVVGAALVCIPLLSGGASLDLSTDELAIAAIPARDKFRDMPVLDIKTADQ